jgi:hypothetical protein
MSNQSHKVKKNLQLKKRRKEKKVKKPLKLPLNDLKFK